MSFSSFLIFVSAIASAFAEWPLFDDGKCTVGKHYCSEHLRDAYFTGNWNDRKDPRIVWKCYEDDTTGEPTLKIKKMCSATEWCVMNYGVVGYYGGCWPIEDWDDFTLMKSEYNPDWKEEWRREADLKDD